ncbi:MAG: hypothetical protein ACFB50_10525 [Rubrobacteraceae bacterium]
MSDATKSLLVLTVFYTFAAALVAFATDIFSFRASYEGSGREILMQMTRLAVFVVLAVILVFKGGWKGVLAAIVMVLAATTIEWILFPLAFGWAATSDPSGYADRFGSVGRPPYSEWPAIYDVLAVGISAALTQGLKMMAHVNPTGPQDE